jgi:YVTN family beta-propeller protein
MGPYVSIVYVANSGDNTVSVIDEQSNTKIGKDIPVGHDPIGIAVLMSYGRVYVANFRDNTVSVINGTSNTKIGKDIPVGSGPAAIGTDSLTKTIYVANNGDNTVSVIDGKTNKVVARVMFKTEPFNAGYIECGEDKLKAPISQQIYVWSGSECTAKPYQDFEFVSWQEDLGHNSTQLISLVPPPSIVDSILDFLHMNPDKPETRLNITKFGNFTANFKALPPPIPPVYIVTLFGIVVTAFVSSWLTPAIIGRRKTKMQRKYLKECINQIDKLDKNAIEEKIIGYYVDGKISQEHRQLLNDKISEYYKKEKGSEGHG